MSQGFVRHRTSWSVLGQFSLDTTKKEAYGAGVKWKRPIIWTLSLAAAFLFICALFVLSILGIIQKPFVLLAVNGKTVAIVKQPFIGPVFTDASVDIYAGKNKLFSLWEDFADGPMFIYPFPDGKRFLCDYDDDVARLDFVVDFRNSTNSPPDSSQWPPDSNVRECLARQATNIIYDTTASVRLPTYQELQEVSEFLHGKETVPIKAGYLSLMPVGSKEMILLDLAPNRNSVWPTKDQIKSARN